MKEQDTHPRQIAVRKNGLILMLDATAELIGVGKTNLNAGEIERLKVRHADKNDTGAMRAKVLNFDKEAAANKQNEYPNITWT